MKNKNILHVVNIYFVLPFFIGNQFLFFRDKGYNLFVACSSSKYLKQYSLDMGFKYIETPINRSITIFDDIKSIIRIYKFIRENNIGVIVGHTPKGGFIGMIAGLLCGVPNRIYFRHGLVYETSSGVKRFLLKNVDRIASLCATKIICVSFSVLSKSNRDKLAPKKKQSVLGQGTCNGVDTKFKFNPSLIDAAEVTKLREKYNINSDDFVIGYTGRLVKDKGIQDLVLAMDMMSYQKNYKLLLVGMFEDRDALPDDIKERILNDKSIIYTGFINDKIELYYSLMNVYVLPSYREGFPTGVLEAQAMSIPVITTNVTGCCDSIVDGLTGLFTSHAPSEIAAKIDDIRFNKSIDGKMGRKWVCEHFDSRIIWREIEKLYNT